MSTFRWLGLAAGVALVGLLFHHVGWASVQESLTRVGWNYLLILTFPLTWNLLNTKGLASVVVGHHFRMPLAMIWRVRLAGEAFNSLLPSGYLGGEPVKATLLTSRMPLRQATSVILIAKSAQSVAMVPYIGLGFLLGGAARAGQRLPALEWTAFALLTTGVCLFVWLLAHRSFGRFARALERILPPWRWLDGLHEKSLALDETLGEFYARGHGPFARSVLWHAAGWLAGATELMLIFSLLGHPISFTQAWFVGAMAQLGSVVGLLAPAGIGLYEGGHYLAAQLLGLPPTLGVSAALIRRIREAAWNVLGLYFFWTLRGAKASR